MRFHWLSLDILKLPYPCPYTLHFFSPDFEAKCDMKNGKVELNVIVEEASSQADPNLLANTQFNGTLYMA